MVEKSIENYILEVLVEDAQMHASNFILFLKAQNMQFERSPTNYWADKLYWYVKFQNEFIGFILINGYDSVGDETEPEGWTFRSDNYNSSIFANFPLDEITKKIAFEHIDFGTCGGGITVELFGQEFCPVCDSTTFRFDNPDAEALECIKKLVDIRRADIARNI